MTDDNKFRVLGIEHAKEVTMFDADKTYDTVKAEEILTATPTMIRTTDGRVFFKETDTDRNARIADLEASLAVATHWQGNLATIIRLRAVVDAAIGWVADDESGDLNSADQGSARLHNAVRAYQAEEKKLVEGRKSARAYRPTPIKLCPTCDGKRTIGSWDGKGGFTYTTCGTCKGEGTLVGPEWGVCQHCKKQLSFAHNCCTSCADERGP